MAGEAQGTKDTSGNILQDAIEKSMPVFGGHPAMMTSDDDLDPNGNDKDEQASGKAPNEDDTDKDGGKSKGEGDEWKPKYKNQQEAEKAYKSAERAMHDAKQEAKEAKETAAKLQKELEETKVAQQAGDATKKDVKEAQKKVDEAETRKTVAQNVKNALVKMNKLNTDDPDYYDKVGELWAEAGFGGGAVFDPKDIEALVDKKVQEMMNGREAQAASDQAARAGVKKANEVAAESGLNMKEGSHDHRLFWMLAQQASKDLSFDEQVAWAVSEVKSFKEGITGVKQTRQAEQFQKDNAIMERGGGSPPAKRSGDTKPMSITEALSQTARRI